MKARVVLSKLGHALQLALSPSSEGHIADISSCESSPDTACVRHNSCGLAASKEVPSPFLLPRVNVALQNIQDSEATRRHTYGNLTILLVVISRQDLYHKRYLQSCLDGEVCINTAKIHLATPKIKVYSPGKLADLYSLKSLLK